MQSATFTYHGMTGRVEYDSAKGCYMVTIGCMIFREDALHPEMELYDVIQQAKRGKQSVVPPLSPLYAFP